MSEGGLRGRSPKCQATPLSPAAAKKSLRKQPQGAPGLHCLVWRPTSRETREQPELLLWPLKSMMNLLGTGRSTRQPTELPPQGSTASTRCMQLIPGFHKRVWRKEWQQIPCRETSFQAQTERGKGGGGMEGKKKKREKERNPVSSSGRRVWRRNSPGEAGSFGGGGEGRPAAQAGDGLSHSKAFLASHSALNALKKGQLLGSTAPALGMSGESREGS